MGRVHSRQDGADLDLLAGVDIEFGGLGVFVDGLDQVLVLGDRLQAIGLRR